MDEKGEPKKRDSLSSPHLDSRLQVLEDQKAEESRRARQMEHMFSSEAEVFWAKQDKTWREEKAARNKLMDDVVAGWKGQVEERLKGERREVACGPGL